MPPYEGLYADELVANAAHLASPGRGILAVDESNITIGERLSSIGLQNHEANRTAFRELLFNAPGALQYLSGVSLVEETLYQTTEAGMPVVEILKENGVLLGIKVDKGTAVLAGTNGETITEGLADLGARCKKYYNDGARFAKWRAVLIIGPDMPSQQAINENADVLARFAYICQVNGLVPIVEPDILRNGSHDIKRCAAVTECVLAACYTSLNVHGVLLEGTLLKPNMVTPGSEFHGMVVAPESVAEYTVRALQRTVPVAVPGVVFLSGGQTEMDASVNLNAINNRQGKKPWNLSFGFGRALQSRTLKAWSGTVENVHKAQAAFVACLQANAQAASGTYVYLIPPEEAAVTEIAEKLHTIFLKRHRIDRKLDSSEEAADILQREEQLLLDLVTENWNLILQYAEYPNRSINPAKFPCSDYLHLHMYQTISSYADYKGDILVNINADILIRLAGILGLDKHLKAVGQEDHNANNAIERRTPSSPGPPSGLQLSPESHARLKKIDDFKAIHDLKRSQAHVSPPHPDDN